MEAEKRARWDKYTPTLADVANPAKRSYIWGPAGVLIGILLTLLSNRWIGPLLPGPSALVTIDESTDKSVGCTTYGIEFQPDEEIDSAYVRIVFPRNIKASQFGYFAERVVGQAGTEVRSLRPGGLLMDEGVGPVTESEQMRDTGREPGGECTIFHTAVDITQGVSTIATANVLTIRTSKIAAQKPVAGMVVVSQYETAVTSGIPTVEGNYEYSKWGLTLKRKFPSRYGHFSRNITIYVPPPPGKSESK